MSKHITYTANVTVNAHTIADVGLNSEGLKQHVQGLLIHELMASIMEDPSPYEILQQPDIMSDSVKFSMSIVVISPKDYMELYDQITKLGNTILYADGRVMKFKDLL